MLRIRPSLMLVALSGLLVAGRLTPPAVALEMREEPLAVAGERSAAQDEPVGESVGEPSAEDAPVEGEPGPGDAIDVPPDEATGGDAASAPDSGKVEPKQ